MASAPRSAPFNAGGIINPDNYPDIPVSPGPDDADNGVGPETVIILVSCIGAPFLIIFLVVMGKRCYRRFKRRREIRDRRDDIEGYDNPAMEFEDQRPGLVRSVGGSVAIVNGTIRPSPLPGRLKKKRCYDDDIDYGDENQNAYPDDILAEIDEMHSKTKSNGIEVQLDDKLKTSSLSDASSYAQDPRIDKTQLNGYANGHLPQNGVKCTAVSTIADVLKETLGKNNNNNELSITDCEIIIHALCEEESKEMKVKQALAKTEALMDECPLKRLAPERMTMPNVPVPFPRRKSSTPSIRSLKGSKNAESWLHSAYVAKAMLRDRSE